jgi:integrase
MTETVRRRRRRPTLTDLMVAALPRRAGKTYFFPDPQMPKFGVRVRPAGPGTYTTICRDPFGKQKWTRIGSTAEMPIAEAREKAREVISRIERGLEAFEPAKSRPDSVAAVAENWLTRHVDKKALRSAGELRRIVERYIVPNIGERVFVEVRRAEIAKLLDHVEDAHGPSQADAVLSTLRSMATFVQSRDETYEPPFVKGMKRVGKKERERERVLNDEELRAVWRAADGAGDFGALVQLLLLTAQRCGKVYTIQWDDVVHGVWTLRTEPREKGNIGAVELPDVALQIIEAQPSFDGNPYIFAGQNGHQRVFDTGDKHAFDKACGVTGWTLHDLRRTARSLLSRAGVAPHISERVLWHVVGGVQGIYDRHEYLNEKSEALRALAALIERIVNPPAANVVPLRAS